MSKFIVFLSLVLTMGLMTRPAPVFAEDDWQYWNLLQVKSKVHEDVTWRIFSEQWLSDDFSHFFLTNVDTGLTWKPGKYWSLGGFFRYQYVNPKNSGSTSENRYYPEVRLYLPVKKLLATSRTRFEYHNTNRRDFWWIRNRFQLSYAAQISDFKFTPYIYDEFMYHTRIGTINENRAGVGVSFNVHKRVNLSVFYQVRNNRSRADWKSSQVLGTMWTLTV